MKGNIGGWAARIFFSAPKVGSVGTRNDTGNGCASLSLAWINGSGSRKRQINVKKTLKLHRGRYERERAVGCWNPKSNASFGISTATSLADNLRFIRKEKNSHIIYTRKLLPLTMAFLRIYIFFYLLRPDEVRLSSVNGFRSRYSALPVAHFEHVTFRISANENRKGARHRPCRNDKIFGVCNCIISETLLLFEFSSSFSTNSVFQSARTPIHAHWSPPAPELLGIPHSLLFESLASAAECDSF